MMRTISGTHYLTKRHILSTFNMTKSRGNKKQTKKSTQAAGGWGKRQAPIADENENSEDGERGQSRKWARRDSIEEIENSDDDIEVIELEIGPENENDEVL
jgi:hypothetical protein